LVRSDLGRICTTVAADTCDAMAKKAAAAFTLGSELVELRIDKLAGRAPTSTIVKRLGGLGRKAVLTVRSREEGGGFWGEDGERLRLISDLAKAMKPAFLDVELATAASHPTWFEGLTAGPSRPGRTIVSWHDFSGTPEFEALRDVRKKASALGDVAKIVTMAKSADDNLKLLMLYQEDPRGLIAFCMGSDGTASRVLSLQLGAPLIYASLPGEPVAPGQLSVVTVKALKTMMAARMERAR
jgi:3-dehydroquinate dehydratase-1